MNVTKEQWQKIGGVAITAILTILAVLGWVFPIDPAIIVQPASPNIVVEVEPAAPNIIVEPVSPNIVVEPAIPDIIVEPAVPNVIVELAVPDIAAEDDLSDLDIGAMSFSANRERIGWLIAKRLTVQRGGANFQSDVDMDSDLNVDGDTTFVGTVTVSGTVVFGSLAADDIAITDTLTVGGLSDFQDDIADSAGDLTVADNLIVTGTLAVLGDTATFGDAVTDLVRIQSSMRTWDGADYWQDVVASDMVGTYNNGWQASYAITDWDGETTATSIFGEMRVDAASADISAYGVDGMARMYGVVATGSSTGYGVFGEVLASLTSTWPVAYAVYGQLEASESPDTITAGSAFRADLAGNGSFGTVSVLSTEADTWDYGIDLDNAASMSTADFRFHQGEILDNLVDGVIRATGNVSVTGDLDVDGLTNLDDVDIDGYIQGDGFYIADTTGNTLITGTLDVASTVNYGSDNLYPLGYVSADIQIECGVTATFTDTVAVTASALTTATYVIATQITDPAATAVFLTVDAPAANVFNIDSWEDDYTVGTTGITVYWCAIGPQ